MKESRIRIIRCVLQVCFHKPICMTASVLLSIASSLSSFVPYWVVYRLLRILLLETETFNTLAVVHLGLVAFIGAIINVMGYFGSLILSHLAAFNTSYDVKVAFAESISRLPYGFHIQTGTGKQYAVMGTGIDRVQSFMAHKLPDMIASVVYPITMVAMILRIDWRFGIAMMIGIAIAYIFHYLSMGRGGAKHMMDLYYTALDDMESAAVECTHGITLLKTFGPSISAYRRFERSVSDYTKMVIPYTKNWEKYMGVFVALISNIYLFIMPAVILLMPKTANLPAFAVNVVFYLVMAPSLASVIPKAGRIMEEFMRVYEEIERMDQVFDRPPIRNNVDGEVPTSNEISFSAVSFAYNTDRKALDTVSFTAPEGQMTAIVGASGSGKSTIVSLIARFWDVEEGSIALGGIDIREIPMTTLMERTNFVFQSEYLFTQSVLENIRIGRKDATDDEVIAAAKAANCHSFIMLLPNGYSTVLKQDGVLLSAGQQQRIALARAFLKDAPIIVLDEATASQDAENEALIQDSISRLIRNKTVIIVAHRLSSIVHADQILVLQDGRIVEQGRHDELMNRNGIYTTLWNSYESRKGDACL